MEWKKNLQCIESVEWFYPLKINAYLKIFLEQIEVSVEKKQNSVVDYFK